MTSRLKTYVVAALIALLATVGSVDDSRGCSPTPELKERIETGQVEAPYFLRNLEAMRAKGISNGSADHKHGHDHAASGASKSPAFIGDYNALAILVEFTDNTQQVAATFFDSLVFGDSGRTVRDYYYETSYGQLNMITSDLPSSVGWTTAPQTYDYYVNSANGTGSYPRNSQKLVEDLVDALDPVIDFSDYDNDNDGYVDALVIVHSGSGAEYTGSDDDIWSHKWAISPRYRDGVYIYEFTVQPEYWLTPGDMTIGVYAHELGHGFGLPDLYDTDYSSKGVGKWCIMSYGSWLGPSGRGGCPAHFSAWCKQEMGFLNPTVVETNRVGETIPNIEDSAIAYRLWNSGVVGDEYFLVENRQKTKYDQYLPSAGLLIWHIDEGKSNNSKEWTPGDPASNHFLVALEQPDGRYDLENNSNSGDVGDCYPSIYNVRSFTTSTSPSSDDYDGLGSLVAVENISNSATIMTADLVVGLAADVEDPDEPEDPQDPEEPGEPEEPTEPAIPDGITLSQNYPNPFNPLTTIRYSVDAPAAVKVEVFSIVGRKVKILVDEKVSAGIYTTEWDGTDEYGRGVASGIYFYRLVLDESQRLVKKMALVR